MYWVVIILQCLGIALAALSWREHPLDKIVFEGQSVTFRCQLLNAGLTNGENQHWVRLAKETTKQTFLSDNNVLSSYVDYHVRSRFVLTNSLGRGYYQLTINRVTAFDDGLYGCMIYGRGNDRRAISHFGRLTVVPRKLRAPPECSVVPKHPQPGGLAEFTCTSKSGTGSAATNLTWSDGSTNWIPTQVSISTSRHSVSFHKVLGPQDNHATYSCTERWPVPGSETRSCSIVPFDIPINVTVRPRMQRVPIGEWAEYQCIASAVPPPSQYMWYYEGYPVTERPHLYDIRNGGKTLLIKRVDGMLGSQYEIRCKAGNGIDGLRAAIGFLYLLPEGSARPVPTTSAPYIPGAHNKTDRSISGGRHGEKEEMVGSADASSITILLGITCAIGCIILILLSVLLFVCQKQNAAKRDIPPEPIARSGPLCKEISKPFQSSCHEKVPLTEVKPRPPRKSAFTGSARVRRTVRHSYQPLKKGYVRRKGSTVSLGSAVEETTSSLYENAQPLRLSFPDEEPIISTTTTNYANSTCEIEYANSVPIVKPPRKTSRKMSAPQQLDPISL